MGVSGFISAPYPEIDSTKTFVVKQQKINTIIAFLKLITK